MYSLEVCRRLKLRGETKSIPIIMFSACSKDLDRVHSLETGASDYVVKPYSISELIARIKAQLRRTRAAAIGEQLTFEDIRLDSETYKFYHFGGEVKLSKKEFCLLGTSMEKRRRVWAREQILNRVWGHDIYLKTRTMDVHIGRLQKLLCQYGVKDVLPTVRRAGYALSFIRKCKI